MENEKKHIGGTNIQLLQNIARQCNIENVLPINECYSKHNGRYDIVLCLAVMHHLYYGIDKRFENMDVLIKSLSDKSNEVLIIEWVNVKGGGPYRNKPNPYTISEFESCVLKYFQTMEYVGDTNIYNSKSRENRKTFFCTK